jgi:hypothetical protein
MKFQKVGGKLSDADQSEELAVLDQFGVESIGDEDVVPVGRGIPVANQHFDLVCGKLPVTDTAPVLDVSEIIFILPGWEIAAVDELIA